MLVLPLFDRSKTIILLITQHAIHDFHRFFLDLFTMCFTQKALAVDLVSVFRTRRTCGNQPLSVITFRPPIDAPLPGAAVRRAVIGSPDSVLALTISGGKL